MKKKKFSLNLKSKKARKKTLDELKKKGIDISDDDKIVGGWTEYSKGIFSKPSDNDD